MPEANFLLSQRKTSHSHSPAFSESVSSVSNETCEKHCATNREGLSVPIQWYSRSGLFAETDGHKLIPHRPLSIEKQPQQLATEKQMAIHPIGRPLTRALFSSHRDAWPFADNAAAN
jgi:hypothetical protein